MADKLDAAANGLQDFPNRGRPASNGLRELPAVPPYLIRYRVDGDWVFITEVIHSARERA
ncbi:MAG: type II toxin-antitoxin system RelE/ParE family toxin [Pseudomonadota bacterium]